MSNWKQSSIVGNIVYAAGFEYLPDADIICTRRDAPQRQFGYGWAYDAAALKLGMAIDCEPVFFDYAGKHWMVELWKGQYGFETGCEIGVYCRPINDPPYYYTVLDRVIGARPHDTAHGFYYACASDDEMLPMQFSLKRGGEDLFQRRSEKHWWLTGFRWGIYSRPEELMLDVEITFPNEMMMGAFVDALKVMGYMPSVTGLSVSFVFAEPLSKQPRLDKDNADLLISVNALNKKLVENYNGIKKGSNDPNELDSNALSLVGTAMVMFPELLSSIISSTVEAELKEFVDVLKDDIAVPINAIVNGLQSIGESIPIIGEIIDSIIGAITEFTDYSTTGFICNRNCKYKMMLLKKEVKLGHWQIEPPLHIPPGKSAVFVLKDDIGAYGSEAVITYQVADATGNVIGTTKFSVYCPVAPWNKNAASVEDTIDPARWKLSGCTGGDRIWRTPVPTDSSPLRVAFVLGGGDPPSLNP